MEPLPTGVNYRATRIWVLLDQLFTADTLREAHIESQRLRGELPLDDAETSSYGVTTTEPLLRPAARDQWTRHPARCADRGADGPRRRH